ncbi:MAG: FkbM family methyltransferase [Verrucomicrobiota bacterium]|jgi:FkbM family methyltransferase
MTATKHLPDYSAMAPKGFLRKFLFFGVNVVFRLRGIKLPPYFSLRHRVVLLRNRLFFLKAGTEPGVQNLCRRLLREGMTVVDIGANVGFLARHFCRRVGPGGKVFAFEPDPFTFEFLGFNTRSFANKQLTQCAISDNHEPALLHLNPVSGTGNSLLNKVDSSETVSVPCISLDEFLDKAGKPAVDVVKIDVEGAELSVLRGMRQTIARLPGLQIIIEYCPKNLRDSGVDPRAVYDEIKAGGFTIQSIRDDGSTQSLDRFDCLEPVLNPFGYTNLLCTRNKL